MTAARPGCWYPMDSSEECYSGDTLSYPPTMLSACFTWAFAPRRFLSLVALFTVSMLSIGWILQYLVGLTPCPLCIIQRFFFGFVGVTAAIGWLHGRFTRGYLAVMFVLSLCGGSVALRNVYVERVPQGLATKCIPWLESFTDWIAVLFQTTSDCTVRVWTMLGLSIPEWSLIAFTFLTGTTTWVLSKLSASTPSRDASLPRA